MHVDYRIVARTGLDVGVLIAPSAKHNDSEYESEHTHEKDQIAPEGSDCLISLPVVVHSLVSVKKVFNVGALACSYDSERTAKYSYDHCNQDYNHYTG